MKALLITLEDGRQVRVTSADGETFRVITRSRPSDCWGPPLPLVDARQHGTAHVPGTHHVGEY
jgi:hypothetical protein